MTNPIERLTLFDMTTDELDTQLAQRRERRLKAFAVYVEAVAVKKRATDERARTRLSKQLELLLKEFERLDLLFDKVEKRINTINGIRIELEDFT